jgi:phosphatidylserine/phosphatidylglycerophosphate/cardiolipin synthase-like enzyme
MNYTVQIEKRNRYLFIEVYGQRSYPATEELARSIFQSAEEHQMSRLLIDVWNYSGRLGVADTYRLVTGSFPDFRNKGIDRIAIIDTRPDKKSGWFFETVANNRGYSLKFFDDPQKAESWLLSDQD